MDTKNMPLSGLKVVELGTHVAIPNASRFMAVWGAEVIKVEDLKGDPWRKIGTGFFTPAEDAENPVFALQNTNKRFLSLNLKTDEGKAILTDLVKDADVFLTSVRYQSLIKMGLAFEDLRKVNPGLVYYHFNGYGQKGEEAGRPGFDMAGFWSRSGALVDWIPPDAFPVKPTPSFGDACAGMIILSAVLAALLGKKETGKGTLLTSSLFGSAIWYNGLAVTCTQKPYGAFWPKTRYQSDQPLAQTFQCKDGEWIYLTVIEYDRYFEKIFRLLDMDEYITDPRFSTFAAAQENLKEFYLIANERFARKTSAEWVEIFVREDVVHERLVHAREIHKDPQAWVNGYLEEVEYPESGNKIAFPVVPVHFSDYGVRPYNKELPRGVGRDTDEILRERGYSREDIDRLKESKAVR